MLPPGIYPAAVTPFDAKGRIDPESLAKALAFYEACGCQGAVLAGTNGEGPSLSAVEKRDLIDLGNRLKGRLRLILGIATPSLEEAVWLCKRAADVGAPALVMPPGYFWAAEPAAIEAWFVELLDRSPTPILLYNYPKMTGFALSADTVERLGRHDQCLGVKDSSGEVANLAPYRSALARPEQVLFVGAETILDQAFEAGWSGSISGAANVIGRWMAAIARDWFAGERESALEKFKLAQPLIETLRGAPQPALNKACLAEMGVIARPDVRLPLTNATVASAQAAIEQIRAAIGDPARF